MNTYTATTVPTQFVEATAFASLIGAGASGTVCPLSLTTTSQETSTTRILRILPWMAEQTPDRTHPLLVRLQEARQEARPNHIST
jgi:hypothetical protein